MANDSSLYYGMLFIIGDVRNGRAHGFYMNNKKREYLTINVDELTRIGPSKVRSKEPCSPKWMADHA